MLSVFTNSLADAFALYIVGLVISTILTVSFGIMKRSSMTLERECQAVSDNGLNVFYYVKNDEPVIIYSVGSWFQHVGQTVKARVSVGHKGYVPKPLSNTIVDIIVHAAFIMAICSFIKLWLTKAPIDFVLIPISICVIIASILIQELVTIFKCRGIYMSVPICEKVKSGAKTIGEQEAINNDSLYMIYYPIEVDGQEYILSSGDKISVPRNNMYPVLVKYNKKNVGEFITMKSIITSFRACVCVIPIILAITFFLVYTMTQL